MDSGQVVLAPELFVMAVSSAGLTCALAAAVAAALGQNGPSLVRRGHRSGRPWFEISSAWVYPSGDEVGVASSSRGDRGCRQDDDPTPHWPRRTAPS